MLRTGTVWRLGGIKVFSGENCVTEAVPPGELHGFVNSGFGIPWVYKPGKGILWVYKPNLAGFGIPWLYKPNLEGFGILWVYNQA